MIEAKDIVLKYPNGTLALDRFSLTITTGELVYITGPSGSGKTSLLKLLMGVEYPTSGALTVMGNHMAIDNPGAVRSLRKRIGPVFQDFRLIKGRTSMENVVMGLRFIGIKSGNMLEIAENALDRVGLLHKANSLVDHLSWGESQRVAIARAVARKPALILADEPTGNLDKDNAFKILELLNGLKDQDTTVIITTHATHLLEGIPMDTWIQVNNGQVLSEGWTDNKNEKAGRNL